MDDQRPNESLKAYLTRRERELSHRAAAVRGELGSIDRELGEVRQAMVAVGLPTGNALTDLVSATRDPDLSGLDALHHSGSPLARPNSPLTYGYQLPGTSNLLNALIANYDHLTIKQLVVRALNEHFGPQGATADEIREFIRNAYGRDVERSSLSPQISRLKDQEFVEQMPDAKWRLTITGSFYGENSAT